MWEIDVAAIADKERWSAMLTISIDILFLSDFIDQDHFMRFSSHNVQSAYR
jgi:hypothetical protein